MLLSVITPEKVEWTGEVLSVSLPTVMGVITVLPKHIDMITALLAGEIMIKNGEGEINLFVGEGTAQIQGGEVTVLTEEALKAKDVTAAQVEEARKAAKEAGEKQTDEVEFASLEANLRRELAKEKVMEKYRRKQ